MKKHILQKTKIALLVVLLISLSKQTLHAGNHLEIITKTRKKIGILNLKNKKHKIICEIPKKGPVIINITADHHNRNNLLVVLRKRSAKYEIRIFDQNTQEFAKQPIYYGKKIVSNVASCPKTSRIAFMTMHNLIVFDLSKRKNKKSYPLKNIGLRQKISERNHLSFDPDNPNEILIITESLKRGYVFNTKTSKLSVLKTDFFKKGPTTNLKTNFFAKGPIYTMNFNVQNPYIIAYISPGVKNKNKDILRIVNLKKQIIILECEQISRGPQLTVGDTHTPVAFFHPIHPDILILFARSRYRGYPTVKLFSIPKQESHQIKIPNQIEECHDKHLRFCRATDMFPPPKYIDEPERVEYVKEMIKQKEANHEKIEIRMLDSITTTYPKWMLK